MNSTTSRSLPAVGASPRDVLLACLAALLLGSLPASGAVLYGLTNEDPFSTRDPMIHAFDADTHAHLFAFNPPTRTNIGGNGLAYSGAELFYTTIDTNRIYVLDPLSGAVVRDFVQPVALDEFDALAYGSTSYGPTLFGLDYPRHAVTLMNPLNGDFLGRYFLSFDAIGGIDYNHRSNTLFVAGRSGQVHEVDRETGSLFRTIGLSGGFRLGLGVVGNQLFVSGAAGISEIDPFTGVVGTPFGESYGEFSALAGGPAVPEPTAVLSLAIGLGLASVARRR